MLEVIRKVLDICQTCILPAHRNRVLEHEASYMLYNMCEGGERRRELARWARAPNEDPHKDIQRHLATGSPIQRHLAIWPPAETSSKWAETRGQTDFPLAISIISIIPSEPKGDTRGLGIKRAPQNAQLCILNADDDLVAGEDDTIELLRSAKAQVQDHTRRQSVFAAPHSPLGSLASWVWLRVGDMVGGHARTSS